MDFSTFTFTFFMTGVVTILALLWRLGLKKRNLPPGPSWAVPFLGHLPQIDVNTPIGVTLSKWSDQYGTVIGVWLGSYYTVVLSDPKTIRETLNDPNMNGRPNNKVFRALTGGGNHGLLFADGPTWSEQRRFTLRHLREFGFGKNAMEALILDEAKDLVDGLESEVGKSVTGLGRRFSLAILSSLWVLVSGQRLQHDDPQMKEILEEIFHQLDVVFMEKGLAFMPHLATITPTRSGFKDLQAAVERVNAFLQPCISQHEEARRVAGLDGQPPPPPDDFIDSYLDEMRKHSGNEGSSFYKERGYKNLIAVITDLFGAGAETTSTTLDWALLYLATYQDVQKELQAEIDAVIGAGADATSRLPSLSDKALMPYTEAVMMEIMRFSSIAGLGVFHSALEDTTIGGFHVPAGSWVVPNLRDVHFNPLYWDKPEEFNPARFLERADESDSIKVKRSENLMPFAVGKRVCIGETLAKDEFFLFLASIFQRYAVRLDPERPPSAGAAPRKTFILKPHPYHVIITKRR